MSEKWESFSEVSVEVPSQETESFLETPENDHGDKAPLLPGAPAKKKDFKLFQQKDNIES